MLTTLLTQGSFGRVAAGPGPRLRDGRRSNEPLAVLNRQLGVILDVVLSDKLTAIGLIASMSIPLSQSTHFQLTS